MPEEFEGYTIVMVNGQPALNMKNAAKYLDITHAALNNRIKRLKEQGKKIDKQRFPGGRDVYIHVRDLKSMKQA